MPDFNNIDNEIRIANTLNSLFKNNKGEEEQTEDVLPISSEISETKLEEEETK